MLPELHERTLQHPSRSSAVEGDVGRIARGLGNSVLHVTRSAERKQYPAVWRMAVNDTLLRRTRIMEAPQRRPLELRVPPAHHADPSSMESGLV